VHITLSISKNYLSVSKWNFMIVKKHFWVSFNIQWDWNFWREHKKALIRIEMAFKSVKKPLAIRRRYLSLGRIKEHKCYVLEILVSQLYRLCLFFFCFIKSYVFRRQYWHRVWITVLLYIVTLFTYIIHIMGSPSKR
jgi:hypothetical protein